MRLHACVDDLEAANLEPTTHGAPALHNLLWCHGLMCVALPTIRDVHVQQVLIARQQQLHADRRRELGPPLVGVAPDCSQIQDPNRVYV